MTTRTDTRTGTRTPTRTASRTRTATRTRSSSALRPESPTPTATETAPTVAATPTTDPEPCGQIAAPCESLAFGRFVVLSWQNGDTMSTVASDGAEQIFSLEWIPGDNFVDLVVTFPGDPPQSPLRFDGPVPTLERANVVGAMIAALNTSSLEASAPTVYQSRVHPPSHAGAVAYVPGNHAGCDVVDDLLPQHGACTPHGACCDRHDVCIDSHCGGPNDSGNVMSCLRNPFACSQPCLTCHVAVIGCFALFDPLPLGPGPAACCADGDCGELQRCIVDGKVMTDVNRCPTETPTPDVVATGAPTPTPPSTPTGAPVCGNGVRELLESCDGHDDVACPEACEADCACSGCGPGALLCNGVCATGCPSLEWLCCADGSVPANFPHPFCCAPSDSECRRNVGCANILH